jgi:DoxX-like family
MFATTVVLSAVLALVLGALGTFKVINHPKAAETAQHLGLSPALSRNIGLLELSAAGGLLIGLLWAPLGAAAAIGLILLLTGAVATHVKVHDPAKVAAFPAFLAVLALLTAVLRIATA